MSEHSDLDKMVLWYNIRSSNADELRNWLLESLPYEIVITYNTVDLRDVNELVEGKWSAYMALCEFHYFFEFKTDAVAFKLRF